MERLSIGESVSTFQMHFGLHIRAWEIIPWRMFATCHLSVFLNAGVTSLNRMDSIESPRLRAHHQSPRLRAHQLPLDNGHDVFSIERDALLALTERHLVG